MFVIGSEGVNERVDQINTVSRSLGYRLYPYHLDQVIEWRRPELEDRLYAVDAQVIVKHLESCAPSDFVRDRKLAARRSSVNDD
jgi:hypothetical protein